MYHTLKHLGFSDMCPKILKMNIEFYKETIAQLKEARNDPDRDWLYSPEKVNGVVKEILQCADLLNDEDMKKKYTEIKRRLETPGFEFDA